MNDFSSNIRDDYNFQVDLGLISNHKVYTSDSFRARLEKLDVILEIDILKKKISNYVNFPIEPAFLKIFLTTKTFIPSNSLIKINSVDDYYLLQLLFIEREFIHNSITNLNGSHNIIDSTFNENCDIKYKNISGSVSHSNTFSKPPLIKSKTYKLKDA